MKSKPSKNSFTDNEKRECCLMISMGCDRQTACHYLEKTARDLHSAIDDDDHFGRQLLRAEATPAFNHMRNVYNAAKDEKHWRASVWWLERRAPDRYARQAPEAITAAQLQSFVEELAETIIGEVASECDRRRLLARLVKITQCLQEETFERSAEARTPRTQHESLQIEKNQELESEA